MRLEFMIICDNAFIDDTGRLNIIQAFDIIKASDFPAFHPRISIVTKWVFEQGDDQQSGHKQKLIIIEEKTKKVIAETPEIELIPKQGKNKSLQYITNIVGLKFDIEGTYKVQIDMDGKKAKKEANFEVKLEGK